MNGSDGSSLGTTEGALGEEFGALFLDIDGVVHRSGVPVGSAVTQLNAVRKRGAMLRFLTNNASRTPEMVAELLSGLGLEVAHDDVVTSAQAISVRMADELPSGAKVFIVGTTGLEVALRDVGLVPVREIEADPAAVVQGHSVETSWRELTAATQLVESGLPWYASNTDATIPLAGGTGPGNGAFVELIANIVGRVPIVAGKPETPLYELALASIDGQRPLMVGDRLDTDVEGAHRAGVESLWVATGVHTLQDVARAGPGQRPDFLASDLSAFERPQLPVIVNGHVSECGSAVAELAGNLISLRAQGTHPEESQRAAVSLAWSILDNHDVNVRLDERLLA